MRRLLDSLSLGSGAFLIAILSTGIVSLLCFVGPASWRKLWPLVVPFTLAYCLYWSPVWLGADSSEFSAWAILFIVPWFLAGALPSVAVVLILSKFRSRLRRDSASIQTKPPLGRKLGFTIVAAVALVLILGAFFFPRFLFRFLTWSQTARELKFARVLTGEGVASKETLYSKPDLGVIADIGQDKTGQLTIVGRRGAAFLAPNRSLTKSLSFDPCRSDVVLVNQGVDSSPSFLCRGSWSEPTKVSSSEGKTLWTYGGDGSGVDDGAVGDFGSGVKQFVVGFNGGAGVHLLDSNGKMIWQREDGNVWHVEIVDSGEQPEPLIVHSNAKGELTIRNGSGDVLARHPFENYLSKFSLTAWGTDQRRDKIITSDSSFVYVVGLDGKTIARLPARIHGDGDAETLGTPLRASNGASYYVSLQRYELWTRSVLRVYDDQNQPVYEEVLANNCDLLLLEQMCCSPEFVSWFFLRVTKRQPTHLKLLAAKHSVVGSLGQTDVEVSVMDDVGREVVFLFENKIGRTKQPTQSERYEERRGQYSGRECRVVLVAPKRYATKSFVTGYEPVVLLEDILEWFQDNEANSSRKDFKLALLQQALVPIAHPMDKDFRTRYWSISQSEEFRALRMPERGGNIYFYPEGLPTPRVCLLHKLIRGRVEIVFRGSRNELVALKKTVAELPDHPYEVRTYPKSAVISAQVSPLVKELNFEPQKEKVVEGLRAAVKLWEWFCGNRDTIMSAIS
jgi:hypothetical protein